MSEHHAQISWRRLSEDFSYQSYTRDHEWTFEGGIHVPASAAPSYRGNPDRVDPEQALVASLSSCHMLTFLALAAKASLVVDAYSDDAVGYLEKNEQGKLALIRTTLKPRVTFADGTALSNEDFEQLHARSHAECFIANSVKTRVEIRASMVTR